MQLNSPKSSRTGEPPSVLLRGGKKERKGEGEKGDKSTRSPSFRAQKERTPRELGIGNWELGIETNYFFNRVNKLTTKRYDYPIVKNRSLSGEKTPVGLHVYPD